MTVLKLFYIIHYIIYWWIYSQYSFICGHLKYFFWEEVDVDKEGADEDDVHDEGSEEGGEADHHQLLRVLRAQDGGWGEEANIGLRSVVMNIEI